jgi:type I restriction enzyme S subunit
VSGRYARYLLYKSSPARWQDDIPLDWNTIPIGRMFRRVKYTGFPEEQLLSVYRDYGAIPKSSRDDNFNKASEDLSAYQLVRPGNLVMNKMKAWQGSIAISEHRGIVSPAYFVYESWRRDDHRMNSKYIHYLLRSPAYITQYLSQSKGIRVSQWDLDPAAFERIEILLPPLDEQTQIAKFLDYETAKIDALIAKQQQLIALLQEKRQAVISHAVTKGLNPAAPLRDSGVAWLGQVPAHWEVIPIRYALNIDNGPRFPINRIERADMAGPYPYWGPTGILDYIDHYRYEGSRAIIGEDGDHFLKFAIWPMTHWATGKFNVNNHAHVIADGPKCSARWFYYSFLHRDIGGDVTAQGVARLKLTREALSKLVLAVPPLAEQKALIEHMEPIIVKVEKATVAAETQIELLQERRTALIAAAVTGKIDVRGWQPPPAAAAGATP